MRTRIHSNPEDDQDSPLDPLTLRKVASVVAVTAKQESVEVALVGGFAMQHYGSSRLTGDIDVIADSSISAFVSEGPLSFGGERTTIWGVKTDIIVRRDKYQQLYREALDHAVTTKNLPIRVVLPEYLAAMKLAARRPKDEIDLHYLIGAKTVDINLLRSIVDTHLGSYGLDELDEVLVDVELEDERKKKLQALKNKLNK